MHNEHNRLGNMEPLEGAGGIVGDGVLFPLVSGDAVGAGVLLLLLVCGEAVGDGVLLLLLVCGEAVGDGVLLLVSGDAVGAAVLEIGEPVGDGTEFPVHVISNDPEGNEYVNEAVVPALNSLQPCSVAAEYEAVQAW